MKAQSIDISDLIAEVAEECASKANQMNNEKPETPKVEQKAEPKDTLEQLESNWRMANKKVENENHPRLKYQERSEPFKKKEEVLDYWRDNTVTEPYINVILENCFGVPHEVIYDYEDEYKQMGKIPVHHTWLDICYRRIELWGRVLATIDSIKIETPDPTFREFVEYKMRDALREVSAMNAKAERREIEKSENEMRRSFRRRG